MVKLIEIEETLTISDKMPAWLRQVLALEGFNREFKISDLTKSQKETFMIFTSMMDLERDGLIVIRFDSSKNASPIFSLSEKGRLGEIK